MIQKKTAQTNGSHPARSRNNTERKRAEEALRESEERYRTLFERTNNPILAIDTEGNYIACNDAALRFLECTRDEVLAKNILDFIPSGKDKQVLREHGPLWEHGGTVETEYYVNGRVKILELTITPTMWQGKQVVLGVGKDITQRKQAEEALRRSEATYREIFNAANDGILVLDIETGEIVDANATFRNVLGYTAEEAQGLQVRDFSSSQPAYAQENALRLIHNAARGQPQRFEWLAKSGDGKLLWIDVTLKRATIAGHDRVLAIGRDITEHKRAEEALRRSEATYREIFNATNDSIVVHDMETGEIVDANAAFQDRHGCTTEEARQLNVVPLGSGEAPYTQEDALRWILKAARGEPQRFEWLSKDREGRHILLDITLKRATIAGQDRVLAIGRDITERKRAEQALRESEQRYRLLAENVTDVIWTADLDLNLTYISPSDQRLTGHSPQERTGLTARQALTSASLETAKAALAEELAIESREQKDLTRSRTMEVEVYRKDGSTVWAEMKMTFLRDPDAQPIGLLGVTRDITERKRAEEALRRSEESLHSVVTNAPVILFAFDREGVFTLAEGKGLSALGVKSDEHIGLSVFDLYRDVPEIIETAQRALAGEAFTTTARVEELIFEAHVAPVRDHDGRITGAIAVATDVTARRRAEEALRESEERYRLLAENVTDVIWTADMDLNFTYISPSRRLLGQAPGQPMPQRVEEALTPASFEIAMKAFAEELATENMDEKDLSRSRTLELENYRSDGSTIWVEDRMTFLRDPDGRPAGILGVTRDITERKQAEEALRETRDYLEKLIDYANAPIIVWDPNFTITRFNHAFERLTGRPAGEVVGQRLEVLFPEAERAASMEQIARTLRGDFWELIEISILHQNGEVRRVLWNSANIAGPDGRTVVATIAQGTDITERKRAEEALRETTQTLQALIQASPLAILTMDLQGNVRTWNSAAERVFGWSEQEAVGRPNPIIPEDRQNEFRALLDAVVQGNLLSQVETRRRRKDGSLIDVSLSTAAMRNATGDIIGVMSMLADITVRKRMEEALQKAREELEARVERQMERGNPYGLTFRELTVLHMVAAGKADKEIGLELGISPLTASKHLTNILSKMDAASRTEAGVRALREGLLD